LVLPSSARYDENDNPAIIIAKIDIPEIIDIFFLLMSPSPKMFNCNKTNAI
jgi:hypothetical protein